MNVRSATSRSSLAPIAGALMLALALAACGTTRKPAVATDGPVPVTTTTTTAASLPGTGKPAVTIGDKNFTEQFILGELYAQALQAQGYTVMVNRNIGPTAVTIEALEKGSLSMYPEYIGIWDSAVARYRHPFRTAAAAYGAGQSWALDHGFELLDPSPFSDTSAIAVTLAYAAKNHLRSIGDLRRVAQTMTFGAELGSDGLASAEQAYGFAPAAVKSLDDGAQYYALDLGSVQAAYVSTTDGELASRDYVLLRDPRHVFGWGQVVPVVPTKVLAAEGPAFANTIDAVTALLSTSTIRWLNAQVDLGHDNPTSVAQQFLRTHGLMPVQAP